MEEMRQLIERGRGGPISRTESPVRDVNRSESWNLDGLKELVDEAERDIKQTLANHETLQSELKNLTNEYKGVIASFLSDKVYYWSPSRFTQQNTELDKAQNELQHAKRQCELVKKLLADATAENEIMYDVSDTLVLSLKSIDWRLCKGLQRGAGRYVPGRKSTWEWSMACYDGRRSQNKGGTEYALQGELVGFVFVNTDRHQYWLSLQ
jgi:hypothetical protein